MITFKRQRQMQILSELEVKLRDILSEGQNNRER